METLIKLIANSVPLRPHSLGTLIEWKLFNVVKTVNVTHVMSPLAGDIN